ncbi:MAG TPA: S8 family serine peptidase, partial [Gaiellaceae bacterium]|nr:S8 family serine peptidase [Gaiellaceae bacterium]
LLLGITAVLALLAAAGGASARSGSATSDGGLVEVVVTLPQPSLSQAILRDRGLAAHVTTRRRLNVRAPASVSYLRTLASAQRTLQARIETSVPDAQVRWRYGVVLDGMAVVVPRSQLATLASLPGATVWPSVTYHSLGYRAPLLNRSPQLIGAPAVWGPTLATAGQGMKIGIIDDGIDQTHPFFDPTGYTYPAGFPKGNTAYTTPKVIVARAFAPASETWKYGTTPFDPQYSDHATHVAGIAAGDHGTISSGPRGRVTVTGVAPSAYLGNYKVLTVPTTDYGLDGNSPEIVAGIEQAVKDGMDVINLSLGEPEVEPSRDIVVKALDDAADAGVVPVVAAGNDFQDAGRGSVGSPATAPQAISVAASSEGGSGPADEIAPFSSGGPTPISLQMKPDVTAPGESILSSIPGGWDVWDGTSMATPHVAAAAALLKERHPTWTVEQIKSALESTGDPVHVPGTLTEVASTREGGGRIDLPRADNPLIFTDPTGLSFGFLRRGVTVTRQLATADAGGGAAPWTVALSAQSTPVGVTLSASAPTIVAGSSLTVTVATAADAAEGEATGFVTLTRGTDVRRLPFWFRVEAPQLDKDPSTAIATPGLYQGNTAGKASRVSRYRYPELGITAGVPTNLSGPEQVFRFDLKRPVANFGAVVLGRGRGVSVSPRIVQAGDENRLVGYGGLPAAINPYVGVPVVYPVVAALLPTPGAYDLVFDTPSGTRPGRFTFRFWIDDTTPPAVRALQRSVRQGAALRVSVTDAGSGVDPRTLRVALDGKAARYVYRNGIVSVSTSAVATGSHRLTVRASDYEESKNNENVGPVLPNTRSFGTTVTIRP